MVFHLLMPEKQILLVHSCACKRIFMPVALSAKLLDYLGRALRNRSRVPAFAHFMKTMSPFIHLIITINIIVQKRQ